MRYLVCVLFDSAIPTSFFNFIQLFLYLLLLLLLIIILIIYIIILNYYKLCSVYSYDRTKPSFAQDSTCNQSIGLPDHRETSMLCTYACAFLQLQPLQLARVLLKVASCQQALYFIAPPPATVSGCSLTVMMSPAAVSHQPGPYDPPRYRSRSEYLLSTPSPHSPVVPYLLESTVLRGTPLHVWGYV